MSFENYVPIGRTGKTYGREGELKIFIEDAFLEDFFKAKALFVAFDGYPAPFFIENIREGNDLLVKFDDFQDPESASVLVNKSVYLRASDVSSGRVVSIAGDELRYGELAGYAMHDQVLGLLGKVERVEAFPQQEIAFIRYQNQERMVPLHPKLIVNIDRDKQQIQVQLPEGLLDI